MKRHLLYIHNTSLEAACGVVAGTEAGFDLRPPQLVPEGQLLLCDPAHFHHFKLQIDPTELK